MTVTNAQHAHQTVDVRSRIVAFLPRLRRFCHALASTPDQGDDLLQETVERALARVEQWQPGTSLESWMFRIARNIQIDKFRAQTVRGISVDIDDVHEMAGDDVLASLEARSDLAAARAAMAAMPQEQRELLALVVLDGQSYKEAAETLEIPIGTVMSRLARARRFVDAHVNRQPQEAWSA